MSNIYNNKTVAVIGAGRFGTAVACLLAKNTNVLMYTRLLERVTEINEKHYLHGFDIPKNIEATSSLIEITSQCDVIFPIITASSFRSVMQQLSPYLKPYHILIHGTKGFDSPFIETIDEVETVKKTDLHLLSDVIIQETLVRKIGCLSGPNISSEIMAGQPAGAVIASRFKEVTKLGQDLLSSESFQVFASNDIKGTQLAGILKNILALASGALFGLGLGVNTRAMLISRGLHEIISIGKEFGAKPESFLGIAGVGDLIATCFSENSRNFKVGLRMTKGETLEEVLASFDEVAEGVNTTKFIFKLSNEYNIKAPIISIIHEVMHGKMIPKIALEMIMRHKTKKDVEFLG